MPDADASPSGEQPASESETPSELTLGALIESEEPAGSGHAIPAVETVDDAEDFDFSHLLEETHFHGVEAAAVRAADADDAPGGEAGEVDCGAPVFPEPPAEEPPENASPDPRTLAPAEEPGLISAIPGSTPDEPAADHPHAVGAQPGDHDGFTIARDDQQRLLGDLRNPAPSQSAARVVQAVLCDHGHPNPAHTPTCRLCGAAIDDRTVREIQRPTLGRVRMSTGAVVELDRSQLIGRRPSAGGADPAATELPGLVTVPDPEQALSRVHAEVRVDGWDVYVVDRGSKNGTFVEIPGHEPTKLRPNEPCLVVPGTKISLADVVELLYEVGDR
jgi:hypothetical protein